MSENEPQDKRESQNDQCSNQLEIEGKKEPMDGVRSAVGSLEESKEENADDKPQEQHEYPGPWSLAAIMVALYFATFLIAIVRGAFNFCTVT